MQHTSTRPVIVGYDGSPSSQAALAWAMEEAAQRRLPVLVVHAYMPSVPTAGIGYGVAVDPTYAQELAEEAREVLAEGLALAAHARPEVPVEGRLMSGSTAMALLEIAENTTMVVLGSRGLGGFSGLLLGSVGVQLSSHAPSPVVITRPVHDPNARRVVVGIDGSAVSRDALAFGFDLASRRGYDLLAVHAWDMPPYDVIASSVAPPPLLLTDISDDEVRLTAEALAGWQEKYPDVVVEQRIIRDAPDQALVEASEHAALVAVGSRGRGGFLGLLLGSVSHTLIHHARCPVAVVRPHT